MMKIIISRKGFDSGYGGTPSPVMPDGTMLSLPIPSNDDISYDSLYFKEMSYADIWNQLKPRSKNKEPYCHLDPDIRNSSEQKRSKKWKAVFGQIDASQTHLENQRVGIGDLFLFFGWFRRTEEYKGGIRYEKGSKDAHMLFGYLQIGEIVQGKDTRKYSWHPHAKYDGNNTMYVASEHLIIDGEDTGLPGAGTLKYSDELVLTYPGMSRSRWKLPEFFKEVAISHHNLKSFKEEGYFQSVRIGQEFVISEDSRVTDWSKNIIMNHFDGDISDYSKVPTKKDSIEYPKQDEIKIIGNGPSPVVRQYKKPTIKQLLQKWNLENITSSDDVDSMMSKEILECLIEVCDNNRWMPRYKVMKDVPTVNIGPSKSKFTKDRIIYASFNHGAGLFDIGMKKDIHEEICKKNSQLSELSYHKGLYPDDVVICSDIKFLLQTVEIAIKMKKYRYY